MKFGIAAIALGALIFVPLQEPAPPIAKLMLVNQTVQSAGTSLRPDISPNELTIQRQGELIEIEPNGI